MIDTSNGSVELPVSKPLTDWADEIADGLWSTSKPRPINVRIAAAIRKARADALEEAKNVVWEKKHWLGYDLAAEIDALKDKSP